MAISSHGVRNTKNVDRNSKTNIHRKDQCSEYMENKPLFPLGALGFLVMLTEGVRFKLRIITSDSL